MNIGEFLNYRKACPICNSGLTTSFMPSRKNSVRYEDGRLLITAAMDGINRKQSDYKAGYSFGLNDNSFAMEFFTDDGDKYYNLTPIHLMDKFKKLDANLGSAYQLYITCNYCHRYRIDSSFFSLDFKTATVQDVLIDSEIIGLTIPVVDGFKVMVMTNFYYDLAPGVEPRRTKITYWHSDKEESARVDWTVTLAKMPNTLWLPLIPFVSKDETAQRLNTLITFS